MKRYWYKLEQDFFKQTEIKMLERVNPKYILIYIKLILETLETGYFEYKNIGGNIDEEVALAIDATVEEVTEAMQALQKLKLVVLEDEKYIFTNISDNIKAESDSAERVRKHRQAKSQIKDKSLLQSNNEVTRSNKKATASENVITDKKRINLLHSNNEVTESNNNIMVHNKEKLIEAVNASDLDNDAKDLMLDWLEYKEYEVKSTSLKVLIKEFIENIKNYDLEEVKRVVNEAITSAWKKIYWNHLGEGNKSGRTKNKKISDLKDVDYSASIV